MKNFLQTHVMTSERLIKYLKINNISIYSLENKIGASRGAIAKAIRDKKSIGSNFVENILTSYADLNPDWLLTGRGEMIRGANTSIVESEPTGDRFDALERLKLELGSAQRIIEEKDNRISDLKEMVTQQKEIIDLLKNDLSRVGVMRRAVN